MFCRLVYIIRLKRTADLFHLQNYTRLTKHTKQNQSHGIIIMIKLFKDVESYLETSSLKNYIHQIIIIGFSPLCFRQWATITVHTHFHVHYYHQLSISTLISNLKTLKKVTTPIMNAYVQFNDSILIHVERLAKVNFLKTCPKVLIL